MSTLLITEAERSSTLGWEVAVIAVVEDRIDEPPQALRIVLNIITLIRENFDHSLFIKTS
ncbi:MAG: hypothetical protein GXN93_05405 [Candidatus Diapherotrites archaeon]|nr:hypothetical protein [Candidatus Diapherotrites archaeon]